MGTDELDRRSGLSCLYRAGTAALGTLLVLVLFAIGGYFYQSYATRQEYADFPPPGSLIPLEEGGEEYNLHLNCSGEPSPGAPIVVLESATGAFSLDWALVQPEVSRMARVCSYDRPGYGWSDNAAGPHSAGFLAAELYRLLNQAGEDAPYLLVGHSFGGHIVRLFADEHTQEVAGVILLDARPETLDDRLPDLRDSEARAVSSYRLTGAIGRIGLMPLLRSRIPMPEYLEDFPKEVKEIYPVVGYQPKFFFALAQEGETFMESDQQVSQAGNLGDVPLMVITHGIADWFPATFDTEERDQAEAIWQELQRDLLKLSPRSELVIAETSGHAIPEENPQVAIAAIRGMLDRIRTNQ